MGNIQFQREQTSIEDKSDLELVDDFFNFLQGETPSGLLIPEPLNLSRKAAFYIIYYLQEHLPILPDTIELCDNCEELFDIGYSGIQCDVCGNLCGNCADSCACDNQTE